MLTAKLLSPVLENTIVRSVKDQTYPRNSIVESLIYSEEIQKEIKKDGEKWEQLYEDYMTNKLTHQQFKSQRPLPREPYFQLDELSIFEGSDKRIKLLCKRNRIVLVYMGGSMGSVYRLTNLGKFKQMYDIPVRSHALPELGLIVGNIRETSSDPIKIHVKKVIDQTFILKTEVDSFVICGQSWLVTRVNVAGKVCLIGYEFKEINKEIKVYQHCLNHLLKDISKQVEQRLTIASFDRYLIICYPLSNALTSNTCLKCAGIYHYDDVHNSQHQLLNYKEDGLSGNYGVLTKQDLHIVKVFNTVKKEVTDQYLFVGFDKVSAGDKIRAFINNSTGLGSYYFKIDEESGKLDSTFSDLADVAACRINEKWIQLDMGEESMNKLKSILEEFIYNPQLVLDYIF